MFRINTELQATLKANCFLLLYNLVEGSINEGLDAIIIDMNEHNVPVERLSDSYKQKWLKYNHELVKISKDGDRSKKLFNKDFSEILDSLLIFNILDYKTKDGEYTKYKSYLKTLNTNEVSGNLDANKIREIAKTYGFSVPEKCDDLVEIKKFRNQLAHGERTFCDVGREKSIAELTTTNVRVIWYLRSVLKNINKFINDKGYLRSQ